jgi:AcrR family transcriptional regulator
MAAEEGRPRRLTRAETKARTHALLLEAAGREFARKGFAGASVDDIAGSAGFTIGALYAHFGSKDKLFVELLTSRRSAQMAEAIAILSDRDASLEQVRSALCAHLVDVAETDTDLAPLEAEFWLYTIRRPEMREELVAQFRANRDALAAALTERARLRGRPDNAPAEEVATVLLALFQGLVQLRRTDPALVSDELYGSAAGWLFRGLNGPPGEAPAG